MTDNVNEAIEAIRRCREMRDAGKVEAVLRAELDSRLRLIFSDPGDVKWINHYSEGTEAATKVGQQSGEVANRFVDNLVGCTTIEYESDLRVSAKRTTGYGQVQEHAAGLIRSGASVSRVRGILSDTVDWYVYDAEIAVGVDPEICTVDDISLREVDRLEISDADEVSGQKLISFIRKHLARERSRALTSELLANDLGLESEAYRDVFSAIESVVLVGRETTPSVELATELWSRFVDYLEGDSGGFRSAAYVDEAYLSILSRLLSANVLHGNAILSDDSELKAILDGSYFLDHYHLNNMVEADYFGWLSEPQHIENLIPLAGQIQRDLFAYDFSWIPEQDLFGKLMAQLGRRSQRKLLGQEWTPGWLGDLLAARCLSHIPDGEEPRVIDMCCGSGSLLAAVLKEARTQHGYDKIEELHEVVTGFDIDPLAVSLAKTTWVVTLSNEIKSASSPITIPIFHADSLFAVTPVSTFVPFFGESDEIEVSLDGTTISLPSELVESDYRELFDRVIDWAYDEAIEAQAASSTDQITEEVTSEFVLGVANAIGIALDAELTFRVISSVHSLVVRMAELAIAGRNGIWAFILRNTYRPGLLTGQFNGLISNPPWLAMSRLADNPYREVLSNRAALYGVRPAGQSFLHLELGTTHLLHAVDRYLSPDASVACLVPGTIFNGHHHEPFRQLGYLSSSRNVPLEIKEMWQVEPGTFKYPGAALVGKRHGKVNEVRDEGISGFLATESGLENVDFSLRHLSSDRSAWLLEKSGQPASIVATAEIPQQGADLMPRTAVCIEILNEDGPEIRVNTPASGSPFGFTVKSAKELKGERFPGFVAPNFVFWIAQSENLLPFVLGEHCAPLALPALRDDDGTWQIKSDVEIRRMGFTQTARRFKRINDRLGTVGQSKTLQERIDERSKLTKQVFPSSGYLVLGGAGGKHICAACVQIEQNSALVIDQTLYWQFVSTEKRAWYRVGLLNSQAMTEAILPFNPKGDFGPRHIHTLPYRLMPTFDEQNEDHVKISDLAAEIGQEALNVIAEDPYLQDPAKALHIRRTKLREKLLQSERFQEMEVLYAGILGTTAIEPTE